MSITHSWNGTVLTITSDSGTSSADLKGDTGCRGPQGPHGIVYGVDGNIVLDGMATEQYVDDKVANINMEGYATEIFVDAAIDSALADFEVDLTGYATEQYVDEKVADVEVDLTGYATEEYVDQQIVNVATGGSIDMSKYATKEYVATNALGGSKVSNVVAEGTNEATVGSRNRLIATTGFNFPNDGTTEYILEITYDDGIKDIIYFTTPVTSNLDSYPLTITAREATYLVEPIALRVVAGKAIYFEYQEGLAIESRICSNVKVLYANANYTPIEAGFIPVDGETIIIQNGKLTADIDTTVYATKEYVDEQIINVNSGGTVSSYATKEYVDSKIIYGTTDLTAGTSTLASGVLYCVIEV